MKSIIKKSSLAITITCFFTGIITAQEQVPLKAKTEVTIGISYYKRADMSKTAVAIVKKNEDGKFVFAKNAQVNFYIIQDKQQHLFKSVNTDKHGLATIQLQKDLPLDDSLYFSIVAKIENDPIYENAEDQIHYKDANLILSIDPQDTSRLVTAKVTETGKDGKEIPVAGADLKFYVLRLFGLMPVSETNSVTTDEKGEASFAYPKNIPGDTAGIITVAARMEDNEHFGNLEKRATQSWGSVLPIIKNPFPRALFEPHAPLPLIITISTLFGGVWLIYFFIFYQLRKIKEETKQSIS